VRIKAIPLESTTKDQAQPMSMGISAAISMMTMIEREAISRQAGT
jgi:hypothetical protein